MPQINSIDLVRLPEYMGATPGILKYKDMLICYCIELPWKNNQSLVSCIPKGQYKLALTYSPKFKKFIYEIMNVPNRTGIRIHSANNAYQILGCIAPCSKIVIQETSLFGESSAAATKKLTRVIEANNVTSIFVQ